MSAKTKRKLKIALAIGSASLAMAILLFSLFATPILQGCGGSSSACENFCDRSRKCGTMGSMSFSFSTSGFSASSGAYTCEQACEQQRTAAPAFDELLKCVSSAGDNCVFMQTCMKGSYSY